MPYRLRLAGREHRMSKCGTFSVLQSLFNIQYLNKAEVIEQVLRMWSGVMSRSPDLSLLS